MLSHVCVQKTIWTEEIWMVDTFEIYLIFFCDFSRKLSMGSARRNHRGRARGITSFLVKASREFGRLVLHWFFFSFSREREKSGKYFLELIRRHKQICRGVFFCYSIVFEMNHGNFCFILIRLWSNLIKCLYPHDLYIA